MNQYSISIIDNKMIIQPNEFNVDLLYKQIMIKDEFYEVSSKKSKQINNNDINANVESDEDNQVDTFRFVIETQSVKSSNVFKIKQDIK